MITKHDRDRYFDASKANFEHFGEVERELTEEKEKVYRLEMEVARGREQVLAEYKAFQEFQDLLDAEYDASFPGTFKACWERIIGDLEEKIKGVTLEKFPVPSVPRLAGATEEVVDAEKEEEEAIERAAGGDFEPQDHIPSPMAEDDGVLKGDDPSTSHVRDEVIDDLGF